MTKFRQIAFAFGTRQACAKGTAASQLVGSNSPSRFAAAREQRLKLTQRGLSKCDAIMSTLYATNQKLGRNARADDVVKEVAAANNAGDVAEVDVADEVNVTNPVEPRGQEQPSALGGDGAGAMEEAKRPPTNPIADVCGGDAGALATLQLVTRLELAGPSAFTEGGRKQVLCPLSQLLPASLTSTGPRATEVYLAVWQTCLYLQALAMVLPDPTDEEIDHIWTATSAADVAVALQGSLDGARLTPGLSAAESTIVTRAARLIAFINSEHVELLPAAKTAAELKEEERAAAEKAATEAAAKLLEMSIAADAKSRQEVAKKQAEAVAANQTHVDKVETILYDTPGDNADGTVVHLTSKNVSRLLEHYRNPANKNRWQASVSMVLMDPPYGQAQSGTGRNNKTSLQTVVTDDEPLIKAHRERAWSRPLISKLRELLDYVTKEGAMLLVYMPVHLAGPWYEEFVGERDYPDVAGMLPTCWEPWRSAICVEKDPRDPRSKKGRPSGTNIMDAETVITLQRLVTNQHFYEKKSTVVARPTCQKDFVPARAKAGAEANANLRFVQGHLHGEVLEASYQRLFNATPYRHGRSSLFKHHPLDHPQLNAAGSGAPWRPNAEKHPKVSMEMISLYCPEGGLVFDPCCGTGSTGAAALMSGRRFLGNDEDADIIEECVRPRLLCVATANFPSHKGEPTAAALIASARQYNLLDVIIQSSPADSAIRALLWQPNPFYPHLVSAKTKLNAACAMFHLRVVESTLTGHEGEPLGMELQCLRDVKKDHMVCPMWGQIMEAKTVEEEDAPSHRKLCVKNNLVHTYGVSFREKEGFLRGTHFYFAKNCPVYRANDPRGGARQPSPAHQRRVYTGRPRRTWRPAPRPGGLAVPTGH